MRRFATVALLIIAASAASSCKKKAVVDGADTGRSRASTTVYDTTNTGAITIANLHLRVTCDADEIEFALRPWKTRANRNSTMNFNLVGVATAEIYAKDAANWPFTNASPLTVTSGAPTGFAIRADANPGTYRYGIRFDCGADGGPVDVDPEIIVTGIVEEGGGGAVDPTQ